MITGNEGAAPGSSGNGSSSKVVALGSATVTTVTPAQAGVKKSWRDQLPVHPAADLFPMLEREELQRLGKDIKANGLREPVILFKEQKHFPPQLLDGRNRLAAIEAVFGLIAVEQVGTDGDPQVELSVTVDGEPAPIATKEIRGDHLRCSVESFVVSANILRRHLSAEKKRDLIAKLLKADPNKSDRQIAAPLKVSHHTVGLVRSELETRGQIAHVEKRTDTKGRKQPAAKVLKLADRRKAVDPKAPPKAEKSAPEPRKELERRLAQLDRDNTQKFFEITRLREENKELRAGTEHPAVANEVKALKAKIAERDEKLKTLKNQKAAVDGHNSQLIGDLRELQAEQRRLQDRIPDLTTASATPAVDQTEPPPVAPPDVQERILEDVALNRVIFDISALAQKHGKQPAYSFLFITLRAELDRIESNERPDEGGTA